MPAAPDFRINRIRVPNSDGASHTWTIEYKQHLVGNYILVASGVTLNPDGTLTTPLVISGLEANTNYIVRATDEFCGVSTTDNFAYWTENPTQEGEFRMFAWTCEKNNVFTLDSQINGLSSPDSMIYHSPSGRVFFADFDNVNGPVGSYLPDATLASEVTYYAAPLGAGSSNFFYGHAIDAEKGFIYIVGKSTQGLLAFNLADLSYTIVAFGTDNVNFNRTFVRVFNDRIICIDNTNARVISINRDTFTIETNTAITSIPSGTSCLYGSPSMEQVGDEIWVAKNNNNTGIQSPNIFRYNQDFTGLIGTIDISANCALVAPSNVYCKDSFVYNNIYYILDAGSSKLMKINPLDTSTITIVNTFDNRGNGFNYTTLQLVVEPVTGNTFLSGAFYVSLSSSTNAPITYKWDFTIDQATYIYIDTRFSNLARIGATNELHGGFSGVLAWSVPNTGWDTDGIIYKYII